MNCPNCHGVEVNGVSLGSELCPRHEDLERRLTTFEALFSNLEEEARLRRRYELLQASATIYGTTGVYKHADGYTRICTKESAVGEAEMLLAEIESREKREEKQ